MPADDRYELLLTESRRAAERMWSRIDELRARSAALLSAASIAAAFLGATTFDRGSPSAADWIGIGAFGVVGALCAWTLAPRTWAEGTADYATLFAHIENDEDLDTLRLSAASWLEQNRSMNSAVITWLYRATGLSAVALTVEIMSFLLSIARR